MERYEPARFGMLRHPEGAWVEHDGAAAEIARLRAELQQEQAEHGVRLGEVHVLCERLTEREQQVDALRAELEEALELGSVWRRRAVIAATEARSGQYADPNLLAQWEEIDAARAARAEGRGDRRGERGEG